MKVGMFSKISCDRFVNEGVNLLKSTSCLLFITLCMNIE